MWLRTTNNSGPGSLRQAITDANNHPGPDTITFAAATNGIPIVLGGAAGEDANASGDLTIQGNGAANTIIDGGGIDRVFHVCPAGGCAHTVTFSGVTIRNGCPGFAGGGGIFNEGATLNVQNSIIGGGGFLNQAIIGGGIYNLVGTTMVDGSIISANAALSGGGIYNAAMLIIQNGSTVGGAGSAGNFAVDGGGIYNETGTTTVDESTVSGNTATEEGGGIYNRATLNVQNGSTIGGAGAGAGNTADYGGGIRNARRIHHRPC